MSDGRSVENSVSDVAVGTKQGVGARLLRKEDDRLMRGRGQFVADIRVAGLQDVAFVRSPLAHARIRFITVPQRFRAAVVRGPGEIVHVSYLQSRVSLIRTKLKVPHRAVLPIENGIMIWTRFSCKISPPKLTG